MAIFSVFFFQSDCAGKHDRLCSATNLALLNTSACNMSHAASDWAALASDAFFEIAACLDFREKIGIQSVCKAWRSSVCCLTVWGNKLVSVICTTVLGIRSMPTFPKLTGHPVNPLSSNGYYIELGVGARSASTMLSILTSPLQIRFCITCWLAFSISVPQTCMLLPKARTEMFQSKFCCVL